MAGNIRNALRGAAAPTLWRRLWRSDWRRTGSRKDMLVAVAVAVAGPHTNSPAAHSQLFAHSNTTK